jgi:putative spermidine/putrescine transport system ATP-binding protein
MAPDRVEELAEARSRDAMSQIEVRGLSKRFGVTLALDDVALTATDGELVALLGPSGCGKTTLLRCVAGLIAPDAGSIHFDGQDVTAMPARQRDVGVVFQHYALFPNLSAADNVAFPLEARGWSRPRRAARVRELLALVGLAAEAGRFPHQLSGGQQQRVALARALAASPRVLLLDEPLSALDALTRVTLRDEIRRIQLGLGMTAIYVTHDQTEALAIADRIGVMDRGRIVELGPPAEVYRRPVSRFGALFLGARNRLALRVGGDGAVRWGDAFVVPTAWPPGTRVEATFTPESVELGAATGVEGRIDRVSFRGAMTRYEVVTAEGRIGVETPSSCKWTFTPGNMTRLRVPPEQVQVFALDPDDATW